MFHADQRTRAWFLEWIYLHICRCRFSAKLPFMVTKQLYLTTSEWGGDVVWACGLMRKTSFLIITVLLPVAVRLPLFWNVSRVVDVDAFFYIGICYLFCYQTLCCHFTGIVMSTPTHCVLSEYKCVKSFCSTGIIWYTFRVNISPCKRTLFYLQVQAKAYFSMNLLLRGACGTSLKTSATDLTWRQSLNECGSAIFNECHISFGVATLFPKKTSAPGP